MIVHVGGPGKGALTAFDAATGAVRWAWKGDGPAYASPVVATIGGVRQVVTFSESFLVGVSADRGELLWKIPFTTPWVQNAVTPVVDGDRVVYSGLDHPVRAIRVVRGALGLDDEPLWESPDVAAYMTTPVLEGGRLYGLSHRKKGQLFCLDAATGKTIWLSEGRLGDNAALVAGGGTVFALTTEADLLVLPQKGDAFAPARRYRVAPSPTWAHPVVTGEGVLVKDRTAWRTSVSDGSPLRAIPRTPIGRVPRDPPRLRIPRRPTRGSLLGMTRRQRKEPYELDVVRGGSRLVVGPLRALAAQGPGGARQPAAGLPLRRRRLLPGRRPRPGGGARCPGPARRLERRAG